MGKNGNDDEQSEYIEDENTVYEVDLECVKARCSSEKKERK